MRGAQKRSRFAFRRGGRHAQRIFRDGRWACGGAGARKGGLSVKEAHATALALTASLSVASVLLYLGGGRFSLGDAAGFLPGGVLGAAAGALLFRKLPARLLRKALGAFMIYFAVRTLLR